MKSGANHNIWKAWPSMRDSTHIEVYIKHAVIRLLSSVISIIIISGCSDQATPEILEPIIELSEASDISRTEATVTVSIERRGSSALEYVDLIYGESGNSSLMKISGKTTSDRLSFTLTGLKPGVSYSCHIEGGTKTATIRSNAISFTTIPNDPPRISGITPLSTGPLGIIVSFSIEDAGGEKITSAGCEVKKIGSDEIRTVITTSIGPYPEHLQMSITGLTPSSSYQITPFAINSIGKTHGEIFEYTTTESIMLSEPGMLANLFGRDDFSDLEKVTIAGPMNGDDFRTLRGFLGAEYDGRPQLSISDIDLTDVTIVKGGGSYDGKRFTVSDCLSTGLFADCSRLRQAFLPNSATAMERNAFARCQVLETLTIPASIETLLPSSGCTGLKSIEVSGANTHFISDHGVLLNADASRIIWFPYGKTGEYSIPSTISSIGENAFAETSITTLIIPNSVTTISRGAFAGSRLTEIRLPNNLTNISEGMLQNCADLSTLYIGSGTEYVGNFVFDGTSIRDIYIAAEYPPYATENSFRNGNLTIYEECTLHVPTGCRKIYTNHRQWGLFSRIEEFQP